MTWTAITDDEVRTLGLDGKLSQATAFLYRNVSQTQLSIARLTMGCKINGQNAQVTWTQQHERKDDDR